MWLNTNRFQREPFGCRFVISLLQFTNSEVASFSKLPYRLVGTITPIVFLRSSYDRAFSQFEQGCLVA